MDEHEQKPAWWMLGLDPRELAQIQHSIIYREKFASAGAPGHGQFLLIAKLAALLDKTEPPHE